MQPGDDTVKTVEQTEVDRQRVSGEAGVQQQVATEQQPIYQIKVEGHLGDMWANCFEGLTISQEQDGTSVLTGPVADQAALHGLLVRIRNLCLPLVSVNRVASPASRSDQMAAEE